jgi:hypothetical protein
MDSITYAPVIVVAAVVQLGEAAIPAKSFVPR